MRAAGGARHLLQQERAHAGRKGGLGGGRLGRQLVGQQQARLTPQPLRHLLHLCRQRRLAHAWRQRPAC
jgi:hypothetical protein